MPYRRLETTERLPLDFAPDRNALLIMEADQHALYDQAERVYPNAVFEQSLPPMKGPPVLYTVLLSKDDIASVQGMMGRYFANQAWEGAPDATRLDKEMTFDWPADAPVQQPFSVEWEGVLHAHSYGLYDFVVESPGQAQVLIGEQAILSGTGILSGSLTLAEGNHALRVRAQGAPGKFALAWRTPETPLAVVGPGAVYVAPLTANGLLARYFGNADWSGSEAFARIEDNLGYYVHVTPLPRPYTVEYTGKIAIPLDGLYRFGLESIDQSSLWVDDVLVAEAIEPNVYSEGEVSLATGLHDIRIRFADLTDHTHLNAFWMPPGGERQIIPSEVLFPPQGSYANVQMPDLASIVIPTGPAQGPQLPAPLLPGKAQVVVSELLRPRGVAVAPDGKVYVAEGEGKRVRVVLQDGTADVGLQSGPTTFVEPSDIAAGPEAIYVLDAGAGRLLAFKEGENARSIEIDSHLADRARGLAIDPEGKLWIAATPTGQILRIDPENGAAQAFPVWPGNRRNRRMWPLGLTVTSLLQTARPIVWSGWRLMAAASAHGRCHRQTPWKALILRSMNSAISMSPIRRRDVW
ncbi:MAG: hypothetical protein IPK16_00185 [Anaerolineales bacterium]|nr:hypothetical protein [Anaerolineales bacterium]